MQQLLEYITRHPVLVGVTALVAVAAAAYELSRVRAGGQSVGPTEAVRLLNQGAVMIDLRPKEQFDSGHVIDARNFPSGELNPASEALKRFREKVLILCDENGIGAGGAARTLRAQGYSKVATLRGGLQNWRADNLPLVRSEGKSVKGEGKGR